MAPQRRCDTMFGSVITGCRLSSTSPGQLQAAEGPGQAPIVSVKTRHASGFTQKQARRASGEHDARIRTSGRPLAVDDVADRTGVEALAEFSPGVHLSPGRGQSLSAIHPAEGFPPDRSYSSNGARCAHVGRWD